jgi:hypothetical protein
MTRAPFENDIRLTRLGQRRIYTEWLLISFNYRHVRVRVTSLYSEHLRDNKGEIGRRIEIYTTDSAASKDGPQPSGPFPFVLPKHGWTTTFR